MKEKKGWLVTMEDISQVTYIRIKYFHYNDEVLVLYRKNDKWHKTYDSIFDTESEAKIAHKKLRDKYRDHFKLQIETINKQLEKLDKNT